jgi:hypothetical protein
MRRLIIGVATVVAALALTGASLAGPGGQKAEGYEGPGESVQGQVEGGVAGVSTSGGGALPFSGQDLTFLAVGGVALILVGSGFYRLSRRRS